MNNKHIALMAVIVFTLSLGLTLNIYLTYDHFKTNYGYKDLTTLLAAESKEVGNNRHK